MSKTNLNAQKLRSVTVQEALQLLQSAVGYLQLAGITVQAVNRADGLTLLIPNAHYCTNIDGTAATFLLGTPATLNKDSSSEKLAVQGV